MANNYEDLEINQGADFAAELYLVRSDNGQKKNLSNYSVAAKMKRDYDADSADTIDFTALVTDPTNGIVTISLTNLQTDVLQTRGKYVYDVEISFFDSDSANIVERVLEGNVKVNPSVTK